MSGARSHRRLPWSTVVIAVVAVVVTVATSEVPEAEKRSAELPVVEVGGDAAAVELPVEVVPADAASWDDLALTAELANDAGAAGLVELLAGEEVVDVVAFGADDSRPTVELRRPCARDCPSDFLLRIRPFDAAAPSQLGGGSVGLSVTGLPSAAEVRVGDPTSLSADELGARSALSPIESSSTTPTERVDAAHVAVPGVPCDAGAVSVVVLPPATGGRVRVVSEGVDVAVYAGEVSPVAEGACEGGSVGFWVVMAGVDEQEVRWALLGPPAVARAVVDTAIVTTTVTDAHEVLDQPVELAPVALPVGSASLHLAEVIDDVTDTDVGGGLQLLEVGQPGSPTVAIGYAPVVLGPCGSTSCPSEVVLELRGVAPLETPVVARALVHHLVVP